MEFFEKNKMEYYAQHFAKEKEDLRNARIRKLKGYKELTDDQRNLFDRVYDKHIMLSIDEFMKYRESNITELEWIKAENCLRIRYKNGHTIHYSNDGTWY